MSTINQRYLKDLVQQMCRSDKCPNFYVLTVLAACSYLYHHKVSYLEYLQMWSRVVKKAHVTQELGKLSGFRTELNMTTH